MATSLVSPYDLTLDDLTRSGLVDTGLEPLPRVGSALTGFLIDDYPGATFAYSLKALTASLGNVIEGTSLTEGSSYFTAAEVADGTLSTWANGGEVVVSEWVDQSGNGKHFVQSTYASCAPICDGTGAVITHAGEEAANFTNEYYPELALTEHNTDMYQIVLALKSTSISFIYSGAPSANRHGLIVNTDWGLYGQSLIYTDDPADTDQHIVTSWFDYAGDDTMHIDNVTVVDGDGGTNKCDGMSLGAQVGDTSHASFYFYSFVGWGDVAEAQRPLIDTASNLVYSTY